MFLLDVTLPKDATGTVQEVYSVFPPGIEPPEPLVMLSASPELMKVQADVIRHYMTHEKLDFGFTAMLRYHLANYWDYQFCIDFNAGLLKNAGDLSDEQLADIRDNPEKAPLDDMQKALFLFAIKVAKTPEQVGEADIQPLRDLGYSDQDIFDAAFHAANMQGPATLWKALVK